MWTEKWDGLHSMMQRRTECDSSNSIQNGGVYLARSIYYFLLLLLLRFVSKGLYFLVHTTCGWVRACVFFLSCVGLLLFSSLSRRRFYMLWHHRSSYHRHELHIRSLDSHYYCYYYSGMSSSLLLLVLVMISAAGAYSYCCYCYCYCCYCYCCSCYPYHPHRCDHFGFAIPPGRDGGQYR